jgi:hypothetical protein
MDSNHGESPTPTHSSVSIGEGVNHHKAALVAEIKKEALELLTPHVTIRRKKQQPGVANW